MLKLKGVKIHELGDYAAVYEALEERQAPSEQRFKADLKFLKTAESQTRSRDAERVALQQDLLEDNAHRAPVKTLTSLSRNVLPEPKARSVCLAPCYLQLHLPTPDGASARHFRFTVAGFLRIIFRLQSGLSCRPRKGSCRPGTRGVARTCRSVR